MELAIKKREIELREGLDERNKSNKHRYSEELQRTHEMLKEREAELDEFDRQNAALAEEKQQMAQLLIKAEEQLENI